MKLVIQRVAFAQVKVGDQIVGEIDRGALVFVGMTHRDNIEKSSWLANKLCNLRMFADEKGLTNFSLKDLRGEVLIVSQFTLYADCTKGRRPSFIQAADPAHAKFIYEHFIKAMQGEGLHVQTGLFGAEMKVSLLNDGPLTLILER